MPLSEATEPTPTVAELLEDVGRLAPLHVELVVLPAPVVLGGLHPGGVPVLVDLLAGDLRVQTARGVYWCTGVRVRVCVCVCVCSCVCLCDLKDIVDGTQ